MKKLPFEHESRKVIVKQKIKIYPFKKPEPEELFARGIINLDKPKSWLCRKVTRKLSSVLEVPKIGHAGTLDPAVTGVLPILLQKATKLTGIISVAGKIYEGTMHLHQDVSEENVLKSFKKFTGKIKQYPPKKSAVKRQWRERYIYFLKLKSKKGRDVHFTVGCEAGTYIRTLCIDVGEFLGVGAHLTKLKRLQAAIFKIDRAVTFNQVIKTYEKYLKTKNKKDVYKIIQPVESAVEHLNKVWVDDEVLKPLKNGSPVFLPGIIAFHDSIKRGQNIAVMTTRNKLAAVGIARMSAKEMNKLKKGLAVKTDIVML